VFLINSVKDRCCGLHLACDVVERFPLYICLSAVMDHLLTSIRLREDYTVTAGFHKVYILSVFQHLREILDLRPSDSLQMFMSPS
jgi:hypothetical protein